MQTIDTPRQHPFSLYDFIGYFVPGSIFIMLLFFLDSELFCKTIYKALKIDYVINFCTSSTLSSVIFLFLFFSLSYTIGQIVSLISNLIIEQSGICNHHNYFSYVY